MKSPCCGSYSGSLTVLKKFLFFPVSQAQFLFLSPRMMSLPPPDFLLLVCLPPSPWRWPSHRVEEKMSSASGPEESDKETTRRNWQLAARVNWGGKKKQRGAAGVGAGSLSGSAEASKMTAAGRRSPRHASIRGAGIIIGVRGRGEGRHWWELTDWRPVGREDLYLELTFALWLWLKKTCMMSEWRQVRASLIFNPVFFFICDSVGHLLPVVWLVKDGWG